MINPKVINYIELFVVLLILTAGIYLVSSGVLSAFGWDHSWPQPQR